MNVSIEMLYESKIVKILFISSIEMDMSACVVLLCKTESGHVKSALSVDSTSVATGEAVRSRMRILNEFVRDSKHEQHYTARESTPSSPSTCAGAGCSRPNVP